MPEEFDVNAVSAARVLIERKHDDVAALEQRDDRVERAALRDDTETGTIETLRDERVEPTRLDRPANEMEAAANFRVVLDAGDGRNFPVAEMPGENQHTLAAPERLGEELEI